MEEKIAKDSLRAQYGIMRKRRPSAGNHQPRFPYTPLKIQTAIGNRAFQHCLIQRSSERACAFELDDENTKKIDRQRGQGQPLNSALEEQTSRACNVDFSSVRVHTSQKSDALSRQLNATAFTTGQDIFFRDGAYQPHTTEGQELIAHELTHVVQQASGAVGGDSSGKLTVNPPDDKYEREADAVAKAVVSEINTPALQRQMPEEDEQALQTKAVQRQELEEEDEEIQTKVVQRQELPEEEQELVQRQEFEEEQEELAE
jgi:hypothetical protein